MITSEVIYPGRGGLGDGRGRCNPNRNKTAHSRAFKIQSLHSSFQTASASSSMRGKTADSKISKQVKLKIRTC